MKLNSAYRVKDSDPPLGSDWAVNKVKRSVCEQLLKQLGFKAYRLVEQYTTEYVATAHVYSDERMHEVLREIETLITELRQRDLNGSADALRKVGYMLTSNKF